MNWYIESIGLVSGVLFYGAMLIKNLVAIKAILLAGSVGFLTYGCIKSLPAIIIVNAIGCVIGIYGLWRVLKDRRTDERV